MPTSPTTASWLERHGVDCDSVHVSEIAHTARFVCTTDVDMCQIASFYAGAMTEARNIELGPVADRIGGLDLVLISAERPGGDGAALRRSAGSAATPSPPTRRSSSPGWTASDVLALIDGAEYLITNEYESRCCSSKTGLTDAEVLDRVELRVTTLGQGRRGDRRPRLRTASRCRSPGDRGDRPDRRRRRLPRRLPRRRSPGVWACERAAQVGSLLATLVLETVGPQEYEVRPDLFIKRLAESYGDEAAEDVRPYLNV